jgi:hypothetical protein
MVEQRLGEGKRVVFGKNSGFEAKGVPHQPQVTPNQRQVTPNERQVRRHQREVTPNQRQVGQHLWEIRRHQRLGRLLLPKKSWL